MYIEMLIIAIIIIYIFIVNGKIDKDNIFTNNTKLCNLLKEKDYDFLLIAKYGDRVYNPNEVFMKRIRNGIIVAAALIFLFLSQMNYLTVIAALIVGYLVYKQPYNSLRRWYKSHLNYIDSLLPRIIRNCTLIQTPELRTIGKKLQNYKLSDNNETKDRKIENIKQLYLNYNTLQKAIEFLRGIKRIPAQITCEWRRYNKKFIAQNCYNAKRSFFK